MSTGPRGERVIAFADFHRLPGDTPQRDTNLDAGRTGDVDRVAGAGVCDKPYLPQDPRPALLCLRAGLRRGRPRARGRHDQGGAFRAWRRRAQAVAERRGRSRAARPPTRRSDVRPGGRSRPARSQGLRAQQLQDRSGAPHDRPRSDAGGARHTADRSRTRRSREHRHGTLTSAPPPPASTASQRSPAPQSMPPSSTSQDSPMAALSARRSPKAASRASTRTRPWRVKGVLSCADAREPAADGGQRQGLQGRRGSIRVAVPAAV